MHEKEISGYDILCIHSVSVVGLVDLLGCCVSCGGGYRGSGKSCRCCSRVANSTISFYNLKFDDKTIEFRKSKKLNSQSKTTNLQY